MTLTDDQKLQLLLVGAPILSLIGTWMSLRTYARLKTKAEKPATLETAPASNIQADQ
jgi:hypothetical protein